MSDKETSKEDLYFPEFEGEWFPNEDRYMGLDEFMKLTEEPITA
ncbi:hypothetical protein SAMN04488136_1722 [Vibrio xiamenensis]|uniref:Uncharacterized protein n=1 Tax=Vibrio xiamenensis TaxID=861298 RepID=A0A1G8HZL1_9VIBR|nr:hypothetical protein [Vibrio xiamenensis]SDI12126.1 hypothetical protein SAMN04488136_1722 [Vibrio xiamenensis]